MIYLDNAATTRVTEEVMEAMLPYFATTCQNPAAGYPQAREVRTAIDRARSRCATLIGAAEEEICFTSGGTESDNWALTGAVALTGKGNIITTAIEHHAILRTAEALRHQGARITVLPVDEKGLVSPADVAASISEDTALVSVMAANNEVGTIEPLAAIGQICRERGVLFHTDAVQAYGQIPLDVREMGIDLLSASGHKLHGPKGIGLLYIRKGLALPPLLFGGGQEGGRRPGTENVPAIVGFGKAAQLAGEGMAANMARETVLRNRLMEGLLSLPGAKLNGHRKQRLPNNVNISFSGVRGTDLLLLLGGEGLCVSTGSACSLGQPSHVLKALGLSSENIRGSLRLTLSRETTEEEVDLGGDMIRRALADLEEF